MFTTIGKTKLKLEHRLKELMLAFEYPSTNIGASSDCTESYWLNIDIWAFNSWSNIKSIVLKTGCVKY